MKENARWPAQGELVLGWLEMANPSIARIHDIFDDAA